MPFYRYECEDCALVFKVLELQQGGASASPSCQRCGGQNVKRLLPRIGVIYKGNGYYTTDHRTKTETSAPDKAED